MDWRTLPDLVAVALLAWAFASVARRSHAPMSGHWLSGWLLIVLHFAASMFIPAPGIWGLLATIASVAALIAAGFFFMRAAIPFRQETSSRWMFLALQGTFLLYISVLIVGGPRLLLNLSAILLGAAPLIIALVVVRRFHHPLRWAVVALSFSLGVILLLIQSRPGNGTDLALNAVLFAVYFGCCIYFWYMYRRNTAGAFITIAGFFAWASVFVVAPTMATNFPQVQIQSEVWNLPKYVVAVGMILLLLEDQIAHNKHLALHDELTGLPNRRLFQDRLASALERARRSGSQAALLMVDLDRFKQVNDTRGHHVGDLLLQHVASVFSARVRRSDTVARTGGDEFAVILEAPTSSAEAALVGSALLELLNKPLQLQDHSMHVGASLGIAIFPEDAADMESLCITADLRMYDNKRANGTAD